ncbi:MAG: hypothetical protein ACLPX5_15295, partial [Dissulfurispiraceae bacterium]
FFRDDLLYLRYIASRYSLFDVELIMQSLPMHVFSVTCIMSQRSLLYFTFGNILYESIRVRKKT